MRDVTVDRYCIKYVSMYILLNKYRYISTFHGLEIYNEFIANNKTYAKERPYKYKNTHTVHKIRLDKISVHKWYTRANKMRA